MPNVVSYRVSSHLDFHSLPPVLYLTEAPASFELPIGCNHVVRQNVETFQTLETAVALWPQAKGPTALSLLEL